MMDQQQAGSVMIVLGPRALRAKRIASAAPQPGQARCPEAMYSPPGIEKFLNFCIWLSI